MTAARLDWPQGVIKPGESDEIVVEIDTKEKKGEVDGKERA